MSLFRKPGEAWSSSSSSDGEETSARDEISAGADDNLLSRINTLDSNPATPPVNVQLSGPTSSARPGLSRSGTNNAIRELLLHSLLEEKALMQAAEHLNKPKTDPTVQALAKHTYHGLVRQFPTQLDETYASEEMRTQRATAKDGINKATQKHIAGVSSVATATGITATAGPSSALVTRNSFLDLSSEILSPFAREMEMRNDFYQQLPLSVQGHTAIHNDRYAREFDEMEMVGKGGYGKVYKVKNKLDNAHYAVKRIIITPTKLQKIRERGDEELQCILEEVRSLARFEHSNIVRYHGAWMEFTSNITESPAAAGVRGKVTRSDRLLENASEASFSADPNSRMYQSFGSLGIDDPIETAALESAGFIQFEESDAEPSTGQSQYGNAYRPGVEIRPKGKNRRDSQATIATISSTKSRLSVVEDANEEEEDIEMIPRTHEPTFEESSSSFVTDSDAPNQVVATRSTGPVLTLNVQMSLYSTNLAAYLSDERSHITHCFHPGVSMSLLNEITKGVEYLHDEGVVHRDLKPANIFLAISHARVPPAGSVNLADCASCPQRPVFQVTPKIGDFGLVAALGDVATKPVGTEFYRPATPSKASDKLDVFALGVVAFEMLQHFGTRMERIEALTKLRRGEFPPGFAANCGSLEGKVRGLVADMVAADEEARWSCEEVRRELAKIVGGLQV